MKRPKTIRIQYKGHFLFVVVGWFCIISTIIHDIVFALRHDFMVPSHLHLDSFFPFCWLYGYQNAELIPLWQGLLIYLPGAALIWFIITLFWYWREKGLWQPEDEWWDV